MGFFESLVLGIVQGLTEFLPISSTAHLRIIPSLFGWADPGTAFSAVIQLGTMLSVVIYFWRDLIQIYGSLLSDVFKYKTLISKDAKLGFWILVGTIPVCIVGILFKEPIESGMVRDLNIISFYLIFFGIMLLFSEIISRQNKAIEEINFWDVLLIGIAQSFALIPGVSRSAATIFAGLLLGFKRKDAARFSFLLSVPAVFLSGLLEIFTLFSTVKSGTEEVMIFKSLVGLIFACISGYLAIGFLLKYLQTHKTYVFVVYRIIIGILIIYLNFKGIIN